MKDRKLTKQSPIRPSFLAYSNRFQRACALESHIERDYFNWLHFENTATDVQTQPFSIHYQHGKSRRRYTPDFLVVEDDQQYVDEIKAYKHTLSEAFQAKKRRLTHLFGKDGRIFRVITERDLRIGHRAQNLRFLQPALRRPAPVDGMKQLMNRCPVQAVRLAELQHKLPSFGLEPCFLRRAIAHKLIRCDLTQPWPCLELSW